MDSEVQALLVSRSSKCEVMPAFTSREFAVIQQVLRNVCSSLEQNGFGPCEPVRIGAVSSEQWSATTVFRSLVGTICVRSDEKIQAVLKEKSERFVELILKTFPILPRSLSVSEEGASDDPLQRTLLVEILLCGAYVPLCIELDTTAGEALSRAAQDEPVTRWQRAALKRALAPHSFELLVKLPIDSLRNEHPERNHRLKAPVLAVLRGPPSLHAGSSMIRGEVSVRSGEGEFELVFENRERDGSTTHRF